jgi:hypothetical protein
MRWRGTGVTLEKANPILAEGKSRLFDKGRVLIDKGRVRIGFR